MLSYCLCLFWSLTATSWWQVLHSSTPRAPPDQTWSQGLCTDDCSSSHPGQQVSSPCLADELRWPKNLVNSLGILQLPMAKPGFTSRSSDFRLLACPAMQEAFAPAHGTVQRMPTARAQFIREDLQHLWSHWFVFNAQLSSKVWCTFLWA